jgi:hypothetical protein
MFTIIVNWLGLDDPGNRLLIILIIVTAIVGLIPLIIYWLEKHKIPKLVFNGIYKNTVGWSPFVAYFVRVERKGGQGVANGVEGFVYVKNKTDLKTSAWFLSHNRITNITRYDYLALFAIGKNDKTNDMNIYFPDFGIEQTRFFNIYREELYLDFENADVVSEIEASRGCIKKKEFSMKIKNVKNNAKEL